MKINHTLDITSQRYQAIIVDDEPGSRSILSDLVSRFCPEINLVGFFDNLPEAVEFIKETKPELVFLDIELPNYAGYEIVSFFNEINFEIIFVTAYNQYALKAFEVSAVDYLLKPIEIDRLKRAVNRFMDRRELKNLQKSYGALKDNLSTGKLTKIVIPHGGDQKIILIEHIIAFEAKEAYTRIHTLHEGRFMVSRNLKHFETMLEGNGTFFRSHKSWLIQTNQMLAYSKSNLTIQLKQQIEAKLSKYKKADFEQHINSRNSG